MVPGTSSPGPTATVTCTLPSLNDDMPVHVTSCGDVTEHTRPVASTETALSRCGNMTSRKTQTSSGTGAGVCASTMTVLCSPGLNSSGLVICTVGVSSADAGEAVNGDERVRALPIPAADQHSSMT